LIAHFGEKGREVIEKFLQDPLPEIRGKASLTLAKICKDRAAKPLINIVMSRNSTSGIMMKRPISLKPWRDRFEGDHSHPEGHCKKKEVVQQVEVG